jgi:hypothetical protein
MKQSFRPFILALSIIAALAPTASLAVNPQTLHAIEYDSVFDDPNANGCASGSNGAPAPQTGAPNQNQITNAQTVIGIAKTDNLGQAGALIGLMVALDESGLTNDANQKIPLSESNPNKQGDGNDGLSIGIFQQQVTYDWTTLTPDTITNPAVIDQLMTPSYAAEAFFGSPSGSGAPSALSKGLQNVSGWQQLPPQVAAQKVQGSATPDGSNYLAKEGAAQALVTQYYNASPAIPLPVPITGGAGTASVSGNACANGSAVSGSIAQTAANLAWPDGSHGLTPEPAYIAALQQYNPGGESSFGGADCGAFVGTVMKASGADTNFPSLGTSAQEAYMKANPTKYQVVQNVGNTSDLQPGDIFVINAGGGQGANGHTFIYTGPQPSGKNAANASEGDAMPFQMNAFFSDNRGTYDIYRFE